MNIQRVPGPAQTGKFYVKRVDESSAAQHLGEAALEMVDSWSCQPRMAPAVLAGIAGTTGAGSLAMTISSNPWVTIGFGVAGGLAAAAVGGYFGPALARQAENLGEKLAPKVGLDSELGGVVMRSALKAGTLAAIYVLDPSIGGSLIGIEALGLVDHALKSASRIREQCTERLVELPKDKLEVHPGCFLGVTDRGIPKTLLVTRLYQG